MKKYLPPFQLPNGEYVRHPATEDLAKQMDVCAYQPYPSTYCPRHKQKQIFFVKTGISFCCSQEDSINEYNLAIRNGEPLSVMEAVERGFDYYWASHNRGTYCGHPGKKTIAGKCYACEEEKADKEMSPRQKAISAGEKWYTPEKPCKNGHLAERRVDNGACKECLAMIPKPPPIHRQWPDMIISRDDALAAGMKTYRTGKPCRYGHSGWRWVSTRGCLTCQGRD